MNGRGLALTLALCACGRGAGVAEPSAAQAAEPPPVTIALEDVRAMSPGLGEAVAARARLDDEGALAAEDVAFEVEGARPLRVSAAKSAWDLKTRAATFEGDVLVNRGDFELRCASLTLTYGDSGKMERAVATGGVELRRPPWRASGDEGALNLLTGQLTLTGAPTVTDGQHALRGERVVLFLDDERLECEGCELVLPDPSPK